MPTDREQTQAEYDFTTKARIKCDDCGEWIYPRARHGTRIFAFPPTCPICGAASPEEVRA